jgi:hypothetical protein
LSGNYIKDERSGRREEPKRRAEPRRREKLERREEPKRRSFNIQKLNFKKAYPLLLQIFNLFFFFYIIPDDLAESFSILLAIVGGITTMILTFWMAFTYVPKLYEEVPIFAGLLCISTLFLFGIAMIYKTVNFGTNQLNENGIVVKARIIDKTKIYGKPPSTTQYMEVRFKTEANKWHKATIDLTSSEYNRYHEGDELFIRYSSKYPDIARIAYDKF